jgi:hypothetical protein
MKLSTTYWNKVSIASLFHKQTTCIPLPISVTTVISGKLEGYYSKLNILPFGLPEYALELQNEARTNHDQHPHIQLGSRSDLIGDNANVSACGIFNDIIVTCCD